MEFRLVDFGRSKNTLRSTWEKEKFSGREGRDRTLTYDQRDRMSHSLSPFSLLHQTNPLSKFIEVYCLHNGKAFYLKTFR